MLACHGCFGQSAAVVVAFGQKNSTDRIDFALNVTPFPKMMLLMIGVIGW
jgi:hypothetical protein